LQQYLLAQKVQIKKSTIPIIRETKKKATAPINIAAGIDPAVKAAKVKAKILVIIAPIAEPGKVEFSKHSQLRFLPQKSFSIKPTRTNPPNIKVIITKVIIEVTRPAKNTAAIPAAATKLAIILKMQVQILFLSLYINVPPLMYNMKFKSNCAKKRLDNTNYPISF